MSTRTKIVLAASSALLAVVALVVALAVLRPFSPSSEAPTTALAPNSHVLDDAGNGAVTLVQFLDFECPSCAALHPSIEELREDYAGRVTFAVRYFPLPSHASGEASAVAVEAAARQHRFEDLYQRMFDTHPEWAGSSEPQAVLFRRLARGIGLDMEQYDADVADPSTLQRVRYDFDAGRELGVRGTPSILVDGKLLDIQRVEDIRDALDAALRR